MDKKDRERRRKEEGKALGEKREEKWVRIYKQRWFK